MTKPKKKPTQLPNTGVEEAVAKPKNKKEKDVINAAKMQEDEKLDINELQIKDTHGNIETFGSEVVRRFCSYLEGDYVPGHKACDSPCPMRSLCAANAVAQGRIVVSEEYLQKLKKEGSDKFGTEYEKMKIAGTLAGSEQPKPIKKSHHKKKPALVEEKKPSRLIPNPSRLVPKK